MDKFTGMKGEHGHIQIAVRTHSAKPNLGDLCRRPDGGGITGFDVCGLLERRDVFSGRELPCILGLAEEELVVFSEF